MTQDLSLVLNRHGMSVGGRGDDDLGSSTPTPFRGKTDASDNRSSELGYNKNPTFKYR